MAKLRKWISDFRHDYRNPSPKPNYKEFSELLSRTEYVVGFMFSEDKTKVALIQKTKPEWQAGKYNGIGGKVDPGEDSYTAMVREFEEEAGTLAQWWRLFCVLKVGTAQLGMAQVYFYETTGDLEILRSMEEEQIHIVRLDDLRGIDTIPNLQWMIPLALDKQKVVVIE